MSELVQHAPPDAFSATADDLCLWYGDFQALKNVNLDIRQGEIFALLGPNGAGKTTLISIICGIVTPSTGTIARTCSC